METNAGPMRVVAGSGRSGTTWVLDCLADANGLRPMFEPLHPAVTPLGAKFAYRAIQPGEQHPDLKAYLGRIARGEYHSLWVTYRGRRDLLVPSPSNLRSWNDVLRISRRWRGLLKDRAALGVASRRHGTLIKMIRANLALGWMTQTLGAKAILLVRHPCAVVESQARLGEVWDPEPILNRFRADARLHEVSSGRYIELLGARLSLIESLALVWVIENQLPVEQSERLGYVVIPYEDLADEAPWQRMCMALGLAVLPENARLREPSQQASIREAAGYAASAGKPRWMTSLRVDELRTIQRVLDRVECQLYDVGQTRPLWSPPNAGTHLMVKY
jgi:hypothetical protein